MSEAPPPARPAISPARARLRRRMRIAVLALTALGALVLAEVAVRTFAPQLPAYVPQLFEPDPDTGYRLHPGEHGPGVVVNAEHLRDVERPVAKPAGTRRVVVLGDSFTYGATAFEDGFPRGLQRLLGDGVDVVNSGVPGWSTREERAWLARDGLRYEPDAVVVALFVGNDIWEDSGSERLTVEDGALVSTGEKPKERSWFNKLYNRSHLYRVFKQLPERVSCWVTGDDQRRRWYHKIERMRMGLCLSGPTQATWETGWKVMHDELRAIRDLVAPRPVVVLVIPDEFQVSAALRDAVCKRYDLDPKAYDIDMPQRRIAAMTAELGLETLDMLPEMRRRTDAGEVLYLVDDSHWNPAGNRLAAEALAASRALSPLRAAAR